MSQPNYRIHLQFRQRYYYSIKAHLQIDHKSTPFSISDFRCKVIDNNNRHRYCYFVWRDSNFKQIKDDITLCPGKEYNFMIYYSKNNDKEFLSDDILIFNINNQLKFQLNPPPKNITENNLMNHIPTNELAYKFDNCTATTTTKRSHQNADDESDVDSSKHQQKRSRSSRIIDDEEDEEDEDEEIVEKKNEKDEGKKNEKEKEKDEDEMVEDPFIKAVLKVSTDYRTKLREHQNLRTQLHKTKTRINELTERKNEIKQAFKLVVEEQQQQERILIETDTKINQIMHELTSIKQQFPIPTEPGFNTPVSQTTHEQPIEDDQVATTK